jgi:hypothetical protein
MLCPSTLQFLPLIGLRELLSQRLDGSSEHICRRDDNGGDVIGDVIDDSNGCHRGWRPCRR